MEELSTPEATFKKINGGNTVEILLREDLTLDLASSKSILKNRLTFQRGELKKVIIHLNIKSATKEARDFMTKEGQKGIRAGAFIVGNKVTSVIINFYLSVNKPYVPARFFTNRDKAIQWLDKQ